MGAELDATMQAMIDAENEWVEVDSMIRDLKAVIGGFGEQTAQLDTELEASKASLEKLQSLAVQFEGLRDTIAEQQSDTVPVPVVDAAIEVSADAVTEPSVDSTAQQPMNPTAEAAP